MTLNGETTSARRQAPCVRLGSSFGSAWRNVRRPEGSPTSRPSAWVLRPCNFDALSPKRPWIWLWVWKHALTHLPATLPLAKVSIACFRSLASVKGGRRRKTWGREEGKGNKEQRGRCRRNKGNSDRNKSRKRGTKKVEVIHSDFFFITPESENVTLTCVWWRVFPRRAAVTQFAAASCNLVTALVYRVRNNTRVGNDHTLSHRAQS